MIYHKMGYINKARHLSMSDVIMCTSHNGIVNDSEWTAAAGLAFTRIIVHPDCKCAE